MPLHGYTTDRRPPTVIDHFLAHAFQLTLALWGALGGVMLTVSSIVDEVSVSPSVDMLPDWLAASLGVLLVVGGVFQVWGLMDDSDDVAVGWKLERMGLLMSGSAWVSYTMVLAVIFPRSVLSWGLGLAVITATGLRYVATVHSERRLRKAIS